MKQITYSYLSYSETRHKSLEEIASSFGDELVLPTEDEVAVEGGIMEDKAGAGYVETVEKR